MASLRLPSFIFHAPPQLRPLLFARYASNSTSSAVVEHLPRIAQPSLWKTFIPRFMRRDAMTSPKESNPKGLLSRFLANPASGVIILGMLTGNASIHIIRMKRDATVYSRNMDEKIALLREVIDRVQRGEDVDVEKLLGTGDPKMEEEWFDGTLRKDTSCYVRFSDRGQADWDVPPLAIREIEKQETVMSRNQRQRLKREKREVSKKQEEEQNHEGQAQIQRTPEFL